VVSASLAAPALALAGVALRLGGRPVLTDVGFALPAGGTLGLIGPGGAGKSLVLKLLCGLLRPDSGTVQVGETPVERLGPVALQAHQSHIGMVFQNNALFDTLTVAQNIAFPLRHRAHEPATAARVAELLARIHLPDAGPKFPADLSGGMKKRVCLARAVMHAPPLLLCDDPTAGLDPVTSQRIFGLLAALRAELGATVVIVSHEVEALLGLCDRLVFLDAGRVRFDGPAAAAPTAADAQVRAFVTGEGVT